jgi:CDP-glycerol glycerophosphotransferase
MHSSSQPVIDELSWSDDGTLTLRGRAAGPPGQDLAAVLSRDGTAEAEELPVRRDRDRFTLEIPVAAMPAFGANGPLRDGRWLLALRPAGPPAAEPVPVGCDRGRLSRAGTGRRTFGRKKFAVTATGDGQAALVVAPALGPADRGRVERKLVRDLYYPLLRRGRVRDRVVFVSFKGKSCSDNPLGISAELRRRGDDREHIWVVSDWSVPVPEGARGVLMWTQDFWNALATSRYIIANDDMPGQFVKRPGQMYVQTWHGTLLKRIGFDVEQPQFAGGTIYNQHLARDVAKWDLALSPNPFSTPHMRRAFRFDGDICESGYPRNDVLCGGGQAALAGRVRERLGLPAGKKIVMYAPTWRDNQFYAAGRYRFDFRLDLQEAYRQLGEDYVVLVRGHHHFAEDVPAGLRPGFAVNVTSYPDVSELLLVTDVLITDYSSMMCDFAVTGRPMVFFTYDLADYRDNLRGFNFDFERDVPGPLVTTSDEVIAAVAVADSDGQRERYRARYAAFAATFCSLDDGKAGARACDRIFGS